jgi:ribonuclease BN (tRNA processing enzyme)
LTVIGSADAFNSAGRSHSCYLVEAERAQPMMVDFGATALSALRRAGREPTEIDAFMITHLHGDHIGGFPFLLIDGMFNLLRSVPMEIVGPVMTEERLLSVFRVEYGEVADFQKPFDVHVSEIEPGQEISIAGYAVRAFPASHMDPPEKPLCVRITGPDGRSIAFSGDTEMCEGLMDAAEGADLLVAECTALRPPAGRHCTWEDWRSALKTVGAGRVLLTHLGREVRAKIPQLLKEHKGGVPLAFAEDGMVIDVVPRDEDEIRKRRAEPPREVRSRRRSSVRRVPRGAYQGRGAALRREGGS